LKIKIKYQNTDKAWGGGNQFLTYLKKELIKKNIYTNKISKADIIIINSFENFDKIIKLKNEFPNKKFVHRMDGLTQLYNNFLDKRDLLSFFLNKEIACATIYQSKWSKSKIIELSKVFKNPQKVIINCVDKKKFFKKKKNKFKKNKKIKLISSSWSKNYKKGFKIIKWLDENLDFKKYDYTFVGNSPIKFKNIKMIKPLNSRLLSKELNKHNIFISPAMHEACSNSIIEATACGLYTFALNHGGNPEIIKNKELLFENENDLIHKLNNFNPSKLNMIQNSQKTIIQYVDFLKFVHERNFQSKKLGYLKLLEMKILKIYVFILSYISSLYNFIIH
jgi:glycosyltransferase involved in cell wall biosynthesis